MAGLLLVLTAMRAAAATFAVDTTADTTDASPGDGTCAAADGGCSLRAAVMEANALAGADSITVPAGTYILTIPQSLGPPASSGDLGVTDDLTITGVGAAVTVVDGNNASRIFDVQSGSLDLSGITLQHGHDTGLGGAIYGVAPITLAECIIIGNQAGSAGGGVFSNGPLTMLRTTVMGNEGGSVGIGGVALVTGSVRDSTVAWNVIPPGTLVGAGGIAVSGGGTVTIANTTVDGEIVNFSFCNPPPFPSCSSGDTLVLQNVTASSVMVRNFNAPNPGTITVTNSIVRRCTGVMQSGGYNLFEGTGGCNVIGDTTGNVVGFDPQLGPLADNGGPTLTHAPWASSPVVSAGNPAAPGSGGGACEATDQRGVVRPVGPRCDIGSVEVTCGNGTPDTGEACDDGNATSGDGCDANCTVTACGNGIVTAGEQCEDGNAVAGDCCSPTCQFEAMGSPCASDGQICTDDVCNGAGVCTHPPNTAPCDDGNPCTSDDHCQAGVCQAGASCDPCLVCQPYVGCVVPATSCSAAPSGGSSVILRQGLTDAKDRVAWRWKSVGIVEKGDFDAPNSTYPLRFCVYDGSDRVVLSALAPPNDTCAGRPCWTETETALHYRDPERTPDGISTLVLKAGTPGRIKLRGSGANLGLASLPVATPLRVRTYTGFFAHCFAADFSTRVRANTEHIVRGSSD